MMGVLTGFAMLWTIPGLLLSGTAVAAGIALITTVGNLGGYIGPYFVGWIKEYSGHLEYALFCFAAIALIGGVATAVLPGIQRARPATAGSPLKEIRSA